jgi:hypothetical protein
MLAAAKTDLEITICLPAKLVFKRARKIKGTLWQLLVKKPLHRRP